MTGITTALLHGACTSSSFNIQLTCSLYTINFLKKKINRNSFLLIPSTNSFWRRNVTLLAGWILPYLISSMLLLTETFSLSNVEKSFFLPKLAKTNFPYVQKREIKHKIHKTFEEEKN